MKPSRGKRADISYANSKVQAGLGIRAVSPEAVLFSHVSGRPSRNFHCENTPIQIYRKFYLKKHKIFR